jgi:hypothetical protein
VHEKHDGAGFFTRKKKQPKTNNNAE